MKPFNRIDNPKRIDKKLVEDELLLGKEVILQFVDETYTDKILSDINDLCLKYDESLCIRFYGHYSKSFNCNILKKIPNVKCLYLDCLQSAVNINILTDLVNLKSLCLGVTDLSDTEIFNSPNFKNLTELIIAPTKTKALNLSYLSQFEKLESLLIADHTKNISAIGDLKNLKFLSLNSIKKVSLSFINNLKKLVSLRLILGSRNNINEIEENEIEELEIVRVRGFNDLSSISNFRKLRTLKIEDQIKLEEIHFDTFFPYLKDLRVINCKTFKTVSGLKNLFQLNTLVIYQTAIDFDKFILQELPKPLYHLGFYTTKSKIDKKIKVRLERKGYECR